MLVGAHAEGPLRERLLAALEQHAQQLYRRPYLSRGTPERTLILLSALFEVGLLAAPSCSWGSFFSTLSGKQRGSDLNRCMPQHLFTNVWAGASIWQGLPTSVLRCMQATALGPGQAPLAGEQPGWLMRRLGRCTEGAAEELSAYAGACLQVFWAPLDLPTPGSQARQLFRM